MKKKFLWLLLACPTMLFAQEKYLIKGKMTGANPPAKIFLIYDVGTVRTIDSADVKDGVFGFSGQVNNITQATLLMDHNGSGFQSVVSSTSPDLTSLFLEQGTITV